MRKRPQSPAAEELALPTKRLGGAAWRRARVAKELEAAAAQEKALPGGAAAAEPDAALPHTSSQEADEPQEAYGPPKRSHEKKAHSRVYETGAAWRLTRGLSPVSDEAEMLLPEAEALAAEEGLTLVQSAASNTGYLGVSSRPGTPDRARTPDEQVSYSRVRASPCAARNLLWAAVPNLPGSLQPTLSLGESTRGSNRSRACNRTHHPACNRPHPRQDQSRRGLRRARRRAGARPSALGGGAGGLPRQAGAEVDVHPLTP